MPFLFAVAPSDATEKTEKKQQYRCTTTVPRVHNSSKHILENLLPVWLLGCTNLFVPSRFWTFRLLSAPYSDMRKNMPKSLVYLHSRLWNNAVEFSLYPSAIYTKSSAQTFPPIFGLFAIFDVNFAKIVAPPGNGNKRDKKTHTNTTFSHLQPARVDQSPQALHSDTARRDH